MDHGENWKMYIEWFWKLLEMALQRYFQPDDATPLERIAPPDLKPLAGLVQAETLSTEEAVVWLLALMPHLSPQTLDILFVQNKELDRPYTEFGGWKGMSHSGFLPTGQTAAFLLKQLGMEIPNLPLEGQGENEPLLSGKLIVPEEVLSRINGKQYEPEYSAGFPAKRITTPLEWPDLVLPYNLNEEINDVVRWIRHQKEIRERWRLDRIVKPGYRCLFYGPPGTGKTLTATLIGKQNAMDVYRVDLSMIVSKYIGETEKNLAKIFDKAVHRNWILFFDEADALFGRRTETQSSNDRHANQEVAYLLQRIEDFAGIVILATNLKENIDEAFSRRFQSVLFFPTPDERLRYRLWQKMLPGEWLPDDSETLLNKASEYILSGGSIVNVIQRCAIRLYGESRATLTPELLKQAIAQEQFKEGKLING
ncbi:MAG: ATP-binding protein [Mediterranea sp.]|jgi:adenylate kinase family enzyme|nr:ATP-binding protein [Mediterranea sp.]